MAPSTFAPACRLGPLVVVVCASEAASTTTLFLLASLGLVPSVLCLRCNCIIPTFRELSLGRRQNVQEVACTKPVPHTRRPETRARRSSWIMNGSKLISNHPCRYQVNLRPSLVLMPGTESCQSVSRVHSSISVRPQAWDSAVEATLSRVGNGTICTSNTLTGICRS